MKKILCLCLLLLASSCSWKVLNRETPYAEDVTPVSVIKQEEKKAPSKIIPEKQSEDYLEDIEGLAEFSSEGTFKQVVEDISEERPVVKEVSEDEFPKIKDVPAKPTTFPSKEEINAEKTKLLEKVGNKPSTSLPVAFTGLDDELLLFTTEEIMTRELPEEYESKRALLSASIKEDLGMNDLKAIELVVKDRNINLKPVLISFYGKDMGVFKIDTIGTLLLLGMDPSLIYVREINQPVSTKAEVYLYY